MFSTLPKSNFNFSVTFTLSSVNAFKLDWSKILSSSKGLSQYKTLKCQIKQTYISYVRLRHLSLFWVVNPLPDDKLKEFADDSFKFDENGRKVSKQVENTVGKGEIARNEQFLLFLHCFQKTCSANT